MFKYRRFPPSVILLCVRWYLAYCLSLRNLEEMMQERGISVDHATIHRWIIRYAPLIAKAFNSQRKPAGKNWFVDETYIKVGQRWTYLYRAIDDKGQTVEFLFSEKRNIRAARLFFRKAFERNDRPESITLDRYQANHTALVAIDNEHRLRNENGKLLSPIKVHTGKYLNNRIEQSHRCIKRRIKPMLGFKSNACANIILSGIETIQMMLQGQADYARSAPLNLKQQFEMLIPVK
ncbi:IS6 family transposase [Microvirga sp. W0021]|uniref:IS6 family transposase n=1 Tax=Hohaiivirga grylli TaxID=3133970 RepID=A0ABV0BM77_9HYPH